MRHIISTKKNSEGICNICGEFGRLTEDHTPPKGCIRISKVEMKHVVDYFHTDKSVTKGRISQNGVKYKTLCPRCNNVLLGANYDKALISFVNTTGNYIKSPIHLPKNMSVNGQPQKIMRSILGHLAAQGVDRYQKGPDTIPLRDYFIDETLPLPENANFYYWIYPYETQVLTRDCVYLDIKFEKPFGIWFIKFFPIAFMVTWDEPTNHRFNLAGLVTWRFTGINDEADIPIRLDTVVHQHWPETPLIDGIVVTYGRDAIIAENKPSNLSLTKVRQAVRGLQ